MFAELMGFFAALKEISSTLKLLVGEVKKLQQDQIDSALSKIRSDVNETIIKIQNAKTDQERTDLAKLLNSHLSK